MALILATSLVSMPISTVSAGTDIIAATVGQTVSSGALDYPYQRGTFYASSRYWVFWWDDPDDYLVYSSSLNGVAWKSEAVVDNVEAGNLFSVCSDGTYLHYVKSDSVGDPLVYRKGLCNADGTITWSVAQTAVPAGDYIIEAPTICVTSDNKPVVGYARRWRPGSSYRPYVSMSSTTDGTWTTLAGFPYELTTDNKSFWGTAVVPRPNGDVSAVYSEDEVIRTRLYNAGAASWGAEASVIDATPHNINFSAVVTSDNILHVVYEDADIDIAYAHYHSGGIDWEATEKIFVGSLLEISPVLSGTDDDDLYCYWLGDPTSEHIYYKKQVGGVWDVAASDWFIDSGSFDETLISCAYEQAPTGYVPVVWQPSLGTNAFKIRFAARTLSTNCGPGWICVTATGTEVDITISPDHYDLGAIPLSYEKIIPSGYFTLTNNTPDGVDITVRATDMVGATQTWHLSDVQTPGDHTYGLILNPQDDSVATIGFDVGALQLVGMSGGDESEGVGFGATAIGLKQVAQAFLTDMAASDTQHLGLWFGGPTSNIGAEDMTGYVIFEAVLH